MQIDKSTVLQILGSLMKNPTFLAETDKYVLTPDDFSTTFERLIFASINNLFMNGANRISAVDIDNYFSSKEGQYKIFNDNNGVEYLNDAEDLAAIENFQYYYTKLKKYNAIRDLKSLGFSTNKILPEGLLDDKYTQKMEKFELMSVQDIFDFVKKDFTKVESKYNCGGENESIFAIEGLEELLGSLASSPEVGVNLQGEIFNTVVRGGRKGKFYLRSAGSGIGKSRSMVGDACYIAYPVRYNPNMSKWEITGSAEKVLYVGTEQKPEEIQTMILSYLSGINEEKILYGRYTNEEKDILNKSLKIMEIYKENFIISQLPNPSITQVKALIRKYCLLYDIENVFYDYIFSSPGLLGEFRDLKIREDVCLMMLSTALKDIAAELNVFILSSTQVNRGLEEQKGIKNQNSIRGAISIADKVDIAAIMMRPTAEELDLLGNLPSEAGVVPNQVTDIYKNRRGRYTEVRIWSYMDLGTCRKKDLFITDASYNQIPGFVGSMAVFDRDYSEYEAVIKLLTTGEVSEKIESKVVREEEEKKEIIVAEPPQIKEQNSKMFAGLI